MTSIFLLYVVDTTVNPDIDPENDFPSLQFQEKARYPLMWIGSTTSVNTGSVLYDKRSTYMKFKNQKRYYSEYMDLFKFIDAHDYIPTRFKTCFHNLESDVEILNDRLMYYLYYYRIYYGDRLVLNREYRFLIEKQLKQFSLPLPIADTSADVKRERLNAKSKRYYARHKDLIKARRDQKKLEPVEPVATPEPICS
jgi:hypothetical protein